MPNPAVFVFIQAGCPACVDYKPKFEHVAAEVAEAARSSGHPPGAPVVGVYDMATPDRRLRKFAESLGVNATPTTVVMTSNGKLKPYVGSLPITQIRALFASAK